MSPLRALGHALLDSMFIVGGFDTFSHPEGRATKFEKAGIPNARQAAILNGATMTLGGLALSLGVAPKLAAILLAALLIPTTFVGHPFWQEENPANYANQRTHFVKNLSMLGGLLIVLFERDEED